MTIRKGSFLNLTPQVAKILANITWLSLGSIFRLSIGFLVGVWVARYLGPNRFGILSYAFAFVSFFSAVAALGLDRIVIKELVEDPASRGQILGSAALLKFIGGLLSFTLATLAIFLLRPEDRLVRVLVSIISFRFTLRAFDVIDFWFQSQVLSKYTERVKIAALLLTSLLKVGLILTKASLVMFALVSLVEAVLVVTGFFLIYKMKDLEVSEWKVSFRTVKHLIADSWPLMLSGVSIYIYSKIDQVMLGQMVDYTTVGVYSVVVNIAEAFDFIPLAIYSSVLPRFVLISGQSSDRFRRKMQELFNIMAVVWLVVSLIITLASTPIVLLLFGEQYSQASSLLAIYIWGQFGVYFGLARSVFIIAKGFFKLALAVSVLGVIANVIMNYLLIPDFYALGATVATVITHVFISFLFNFLFTDLKSIAVMQIKAFNIPRTLTNIFHSFGKNRKR